MHPILTLSMAGLIVVMPLTGATATASRDGSHDFDFNFGVWHTHIVRVLHPLSASNATSVADGTVTVRKIWGGKASLEEIEADGPAGHWEGMTLFLYNPTARRWSQTYIGAKDGTYSPGDIGTFENGRGEFASTDTVDGRPVLVRGVWSDVTPVSHRYHIMYSGDAGAHWQTVFDAHLTRIAERAPAESARVPSTGAHHDFDFDFGTWDTHSQRLRHPLSHANDWMTLDGTTIVHKIWGGRANYAEVTLNGAHAPPRILALRWYSPATQRWNLDFANSRDGTLGIPATGTFRNSRIDFVDREPYAGRPIDVRFSIWNAGPGRAHSEEAFSPDGKTWETNWKTEYTCSAKRTAKSGEFNRRS
jgi:hypothetical protein